MPDLILRNGTVIDGTGRERLRADVAVERDRIVAVGDLTDTPSTTVLDIAGQVVAPGFIDVHNHSDGWLLRKPNFTPKTLQGFTSEVIMADGIGYAPVTPRTASEWVYYLRGLDGLRLQDYAGWQTFEEFLETFEGRSGQNVAAHLPYANVRALACGFHRSHVDDFQMREIQRQIRIGMEAGAVGVSTGLDYIVQCHSPTDELVEALSVMAPYDGLYVTHVRYKKGLLPALEEAADIGRRAGVRVHISHLKAQSPAEIERVMEFLDKTRKEVDITFDVYPYQPGSTMLNFLIPYDAWNEGPIAAAARLRDPAIREQFAQGLEAYRLPLDKISIAWVTSKENAVYQGLTLEEYIEQSGRAPVDALSDLLIEERFTPLLVFFEGDNHLVEPLLQHDLFMLGTDGIYTEDGPVHPRVFGSVGRLLGPLVRDRQLMTLERAIQTMTSVPAQRFRFRDRGVIAPGAFADLVVFDPASIDEQSTFENPRQPTVGINEVLVNGVPIVTNGVPVEPDCPPGKYLRRESL